MTTDRCSIEASLRGIVTDGVGAAALRELSGERLRAVASALHADDVHGGRTIARNALRVLGLQDREREIDHLQHVLWCAWRTAHWLRSPAMDRGAIEGAEHARELSGRATVVISPMTLALPDCLDLVTRVFEGREVVVYGEGICDGDVKERYRAGGLELTDNVRVLSRPAEAVRGIMATLRNGGVFCTFPDFVYDGHGVVSSAMFGQQRSFSRAFVRICNESRALLLPISLARRGATPIATIEEALEPVITAPTRVVEETALLELVVKLLEELILRRPEQWLLLGTLAAEVSTALSPR